MAAVVAAGAVTVCSGAGGAGATEAAGVPPAIALNACWHAGDVLAACVFRHSSAAAPPVDVVVAELVVVVGVLVEDVVVVDAVVPPALTVTVFVFSPPSDV